ncbi:hypothetical protein K432DRAFT_309307, partial [Lepidopterella palustris CBS 459.81]
AETLLKDLEMERQTNDEKERPILFVCHSLGGLIVKQYSNLGKIYSCTNGVMFFGTPHRGSTTTSLARLVANVAKIAFKQPNNNRRHVIDQDQNTLERQSKSFAVISTDMILVSIFEERPTHHAGIVSPLYTAPPKCY